MALKKGTKIERGYATVDSDGVNYREISEVMTEMGWPMNHSSARNYVLRAMRKFAVGLSAAEGVELGARELEELATSPAFQSLVGDLLSQVEVSRREAP